MQSVRGATLAEAMDKAYHGQRSMETCLLELGRAQGSALRELTTALRELTTALREPPFGAQRVV